jgi:dihydroneopterin aldolase
MVCFLAGTLMETLYKTVLFHDTSLVIGINAAQNDIDKADFTTNYFDLTEAINELMINENCILIEKSYTEFKALVTDWTDIKHKCIPNRCEIYLIQTE